jgi:hypothetical protein
MFTISDQTRQQILEAFDKNEEIVSQYNYGKSSRESEKEYLEAKKTNPDLELPSALKFTTITGIENQIKSCDVNPDKDNAHQFPGFYLLYQPQDKNGASRFSIEKFLITKVQ